MIDNVIDYFRFETSCYVTKEYDSRQLEYSGDIIGEVAVEPRMTLARISDVTITVCVSISDDDILLKSNAEVIAVTGTVTPA